MQNKVTKFKKLFADILYNELSNRETSLLESDSIVGAVYLDPHSQILLSTAQKVQAVQHIKNIWNKLQFLEPATNESAQSTCETTETTDEKVDDVQDYLKSKELAIEKHKIPNLYGCGHCRYRVSQTD